MPSTRRNSWIWLTRRQIDVLLAIGAVLDETPTSLATVLPAKGDRAAFRSAMATLRKVHQAMEAGA